MTKNEYKNLLKSGWYLPAKAKYWNIEKLSEFLSIKYFLHPTFAKEERKIAKNIRLYYGMFRESGGIFWGFDEEDK
jgi:hypothetical protein